MAKSHLSVCSDACLRTDLDYAGNDINVATGAGADMRGSAEECQALCSQRSGCNYFSWHRSVIYCWLNAGVTSVTTNTDSVSGPANCGEYFLLPPSPFTSPVN